MHIADDHIRLHRRMERRLGRSVSDAAWAVAIDERYVAEALDPDEPGGGDGLLAFLVRLLRVEDAGLARAARRPEVSWSAAPTEDVAARTEAISRLAAEQAAGDKGIIRFRQRILGRDTPMSRSEAEAYLELPEARRTSDAEASSGMTAVMQYQNRRVAHDIHVWPGSPLDELRQLADDLARSYPWQPAQAAAFVLEGLVPLATPFLLRMPQTPQGDRPARAQLIMEVDLWTPAEAVMRAYRDAQRQVLPGYNRPVSRRSIDVVNFVVQHRPATWPDLLQRWNTEHPGRTFSDYRTFRTAFDRARRSLLSPDYRIHVGPDRP